MKNNGVISDLHFVDKSSGKTIYSTIGRQELLEHIKNLSGVSLILVPSYSFLAGKEGEWYYIIDSHVINHTLGGNGNGILKVFKKHSDMAKWIWRQMSLSNVKPETRQQIIRIERQCPGATPFNEQCIASRSRHGGSLAMKQQGQQSLASQQPVISGGAAVQASVSVMQESGLQMQESKSLMHEWGPHKLPYVPSYTRKLKNSEMLALVLSDHRRAARIPQACRKNEVFIIDSLKIENPNDLQSDLNGVFPVCIEIKTYTVNVISESVKVAAKNAPS